MDRDELLSQLESLNARLDELTERARRMGEENRSLRQQQESIVGERAQLLSKNEQARSRVEAMIARLKSLDADAAAAILPLVLAGALIGFLFYNWHPAKSFMGDGGSLSIGFLLAVSIVFANAAGST